MCAELTNTQRHVFLAVWIAAATGAAGLLWVGGGQRLLGTIVFLVGLAGFTLGVTFPAMVSAAHVAMRRLGRPIQLLAAGVLLTGVYVIIIIPIGFVSRWWRHDPLACARDENTESYWNDENADTSLDRRFRPF